MNFCHLKIGFNLLKQNMDGGRLFYETDVCKKGSIKSIKKEKSEENMNQQCFTRMKISLLALFALACFASVLGVSAESTQLINVNGTGTVSLQPDIVKISIGFNTRNEDVQAAINENTQKVESVKNALFAEGLTDGDIKTTSYSLYSSSGTYQDSVFGSEKPVYNVDYYLDITLNDLSKLNLILDMVVNNGANNISGITYDSSERAAAYDQARDLAIDDGQAQAEKIAGKLGVTLDQVTSITVNDYNYTPYYGAAPVVFDQKSEDVGTPSMNPGLVDISVRVDLSYSYRL